MKLILLRCDSSNLIGSGHVMRCRNLARKLYKNGAKIIFICRKNKGDLIDLLQKEFEVLIIENNLLNSIYKNPREDIPLEKIEQIRDSKASCKLINDRGLSDIDWIIIDHYKLDSEWESSIKNDLKIHKNLKLFAIDDLRNRKHNVDITLDQNYYNFNDFNKINLNKNTKFLFGFQYALLSEEYALLHDSVPKRKKLSRVIIFLGGADPDQIIFDVINILKKTPFSKLNFDIVVGSQSEYLQKVKDLVSNNKNFQIYNYFESLAPLFIRADAAIGAGGISSLERACLMLPSIVITFGLDQFAASNSFYSDGYNIFIGDKSNISYEKIYNSIEYLSNNIENIKTGYHLVDGKGVERVSIAIMGPKYPIFLRDAVKKDMSILWQWVNDIDVRKNSFNSSYIKFEHHEKWFLETLKNKKRRIYIVTDSNSVPLGQIRFDLSESGEFSIIDISIDSCARSYKLSSQIIIKGIERIREEWDSIVYFKAKVLKSNYKSISCFKKAGFTIKDDILINNSVLLILNNA